MDDKCERSKYRIKKSEDDYYSAERNLKDEDINTALNRAYYSIFHMMTALLILDDLNFKSHHAVIARFREKYIKTNTFDVKISDIISDLFEYRNDSDYMDFFWATQKEAEVQVNNAKIFFNEVKPYIEKRLEE